MSYKQAVQAAAPLCDAELLYKRELGAYELLTPAEEQALARCRMKGDKVARNTLVERNLRLVHRVARNYRTQRIPMMDLLQEGNLGLMKAASKFEDRGFRFGTYAMWWIQNCIEAAVETTYGAIVKRPCTLFDLASTIRKLRRSHTASGRELTTSEVAAALDVPEDEIWHALSVRQETDVSFDKPLRSYTQEVDDDKTLYGCVADADAWPPDVAIEARDTLAMARARSEVLIKHVREMADVVDREKEMFALYYRVGAAGELSTMPQIGARFGCSQAWVGQVLKKLRRGLRARGYVVDRTSLEKERELIARLVELVSTIT
jgi:RNA polymerase primary sigma factor